MSSSRAKSSSAKSDPSARSLPPLQEGQRDTIPAPPPSAASLASVQDESERDLPVESRIESRRRDTVPAPAGAPCIDADGVFDDEPVTDRAPHPHDAV